MGIRGVLNQPLLSRAHYARDFPCRFSVWLDSLCPPLDPRWAPGAQEIHGERESIEWMKFAEQKNSFAFTASWAHHLPGKVSLQGTYCSSPYSYHCPGHCFQKTVSVHAWRPRLQSYVLVFTSNFQSIRDGSEDPLCDSYNERLHSSLWDPLRHRYRKKKTVKRPSAGQLSLKA